MAWGRAADHDVGEVYSSVPPPSLRDLSSLAAFYQLFSMLGVFLLPFSSRTMEKTRYTEENTGPKVWKEIKKKKMEGGGVLPKRAWVEKDGRGGGKGQKECELLVWRDQSLRESSATMTQSPEDVNRLR